MSIEKTAEISKKVKAPEISGGGSAFQFLLLGTLATLLFAVDAVFSVIYYRNTAGFDFRWILAILDISLVLTIYSLAGRRTSRLLVSMKMALTLLFILAIFSIIGTILPQGKDVYQSGWVNNPVFGFYKSIGLFDMYRSRWFMALMFLLIFNLSVCVFKRMPNAFRKTLKPRIDVKDLFITKQPMTVAIEGAGERGLEVAKETLSGRRFHIRMGSHGNFLAEKGRLTVIASLIFHMSFLLIGIGAIDEGIFGFVEKIEVPDGKTAQVPNTDMTVKNYQFNVEYTEVKEEGRVTGYRPKIFSSDLEVYRNGQPLERKTITVNDPLRLDGINFHQASFYSTNRGYVTVLQITHSPGKTLVYLGFALMMLGISFAIYFPHRRIWVKVSDSGGLLVGGKTNRSKVTFQREFERMVSELRLTLGQEARADG